VRGSLALSICKVAKALGKQLTLAHLIAPITQLMKDQATEVRIELMSHLKTLIEVIGQEEFDRQIIPSLIQLASDKIWRVKLALIQFIPSLAEFLDKTLFKERLESVILSLLSDPVFHIREEAVSLVLTLAQPGSPFTQQWLEDCLETKAREFHIHERFA
jgi:serine/threonine-protein phosphatase 2A regulatory subunit A